LVFIYFIDPTIQRKNYETVFGFFEACKGSRIN